MAVQLVFVGPGRKTLKTVFFQRGSYDKRDYFNDIVNFPFLDVDVPQHPSYGIMINGVLSVSCFGVRVSVIFHFMFVHYTFSPVLVADWPPFGK